MTDRELLEAAARAGGIKAQWFVGLGMGIEGTTGLPAIWNSLTDDGDALRLANSLWLQIRHVHGKAHVGVPNRFWMTENHQAGGDINAATRRAITRAAAAMAPKG